MQNPENYRQTPTCKNCVHVEEWRGTKGFFCVIKVSSAKITTKDVDSDHVCGLHQDIKSSQLNYQKIDCCASCHYFEGGECFATSKNIDDGSVVEPDYVCDLHKGGAEEV